MRWLLAAAPLALASLIVTAFGCTTEPSLEHASTGNTIVVSDGSLWLTSPDDDALVSLDLATLEERERFAIEGAPERLLVHSDGRLWVTLGLASAVAIVDDGAVTRHAVPCGGTHDLAERADGSVVVSCPHDDRVVALEATGALRQTAEVPGRPLALAALDDRLHVGLQGIGGVGVLDGELALIEETVLERVEGVHASHPSAFAVDPRRGLVGTYERVEHDADRDRPPAIGGYGSVVDDTPRIDPRLHGACGGSYAQFDGGAFVFSGPSGSAWGDGALWVTHRQTDNVALVRCSGTATVIEAHRVGRGPRGVVVHEGRAYVDVGFDHAVAILERGAESPVLERRRSLGETRMDALALRGRDLFHDAVDIHLTPSGVVTCATCHPGGGDDGLSWFIHTPAVDRKLRRTPPAWRARAATAPYHWDASIPDIGALGRETIHELMEGDGLLVDYEALAAYLDQVPAPSPRPVVVASQATRGAEVFAAAGCADCHPGGGSDGETHRVLAPSDDADARMEVVDTPTLEAVRARAPYLHDGRAPTLRSVLTDHGAEHGAPGILGGADLDALLAYLESL